MDAASEQDPQRLLADLAAEYERSRRFLKHLENSFVREPPPAPSSGPTYAPAGTDEHHGEPPDTTAESASLAIATPQPESAPSKLRAKLRSLFTRRVSVTVRGDELSDSGLVTAATVGRTASECQPTASARNLQRIPTVVERSPTSAPSVAPRRASQAYYTSITVEVPRAQGFARPGADADGARSATNRRTSVVNFGGDAMDSAAQGWVARVVGEQPVIERPATGRRSSIVYYGAVEASPVLDAAGRGNSRRSADFTISGAAATAAAGRPPERPTTARRASIVQFGDTVAAPGGGLGNGSGSGSGGQWLGDIDAGTWTRNGEGSPLPQNAGKRGPSAHLGGGGGGGGGGGTGLQDTTDPHEFMSAMVARRATSFHQRSGNALRPTSATRLRSTTMARRSTVEAYSGRDPQQLPPPPQQQQPPPQPSTPPSPPPPQQPQPQPQQPQQSVRDSLEGRYVLMGALPTDQLRAAATRRAGSLEIPRPFSASRQQPAAATAPAVSALFSPASLPGSATSAAALAAAAGGAADRPDVSPPPPPAAAAGWGSCAPHLRLQQQQPPHVGVAWAPPAAAAAAVRSPIGSPGSAAPASPPGDVAATAALLMGRGRMGLAPGALRSALSVSSKRLLDGLDGTRPPTAAVVVPGGSGTSAGVTAASAVAERGAGVMEAGYIGAWVQVANSGADAASTAAAAAAMESSSSPVSGTPPAGGPLPPPPLGSPVSRVPQQRQPPSTPLQPRTPSQPSPQPSPPSPPYQPHPPSRPQPPQALTLLGLRGFGGARTADGAFLAGGGGGSGGSDSGKTRRPDSPLGCTAHLDQRARSAAGYDGVAQPAV